MFVWSKLITILTDLSELWENIIFSDRLECFSQNNWKLVVKKQKKNSNLTLLSCKFFSRANRSLCLSMSDTSGDVDWNKNK